MPKAGFDLRHLYLKYRHALVRICVRTPEGDEAMGTGFHIGGGLIATARHVTDSQIISIKREADSMVVVSNRIVLSADCRADVSIVDSNFHQLPPSHPAQRRVCAIPIGQYLDDWLGDDFLLSKVLIMGYPPVPRASYPVLVCSEAEINAIVSTMGSGNASFLLSSMARGGFSGGPIISAAGFALGIVSESLYAGGRVPETGFFAACSTEPLLRLLVENDLGRSSAVQGDVWRLLQRRIRSGRQSQSD